MTQHPKVEISMPRNRRAAFLKFAIGATLVSTVFALVLDFSQPAFAYLDPGTGSILLQLLLGGVAGGVVLGKIYWQKIKELFVRNADNENLQNKHKAPGE